MPWSRSLSHGRSLRIYSDPNKLWVTNELAHTGQQYAMLRARSETVGAWERFQIYGLTVGQDAMQSTSNSKWVSAEFGDPEPERGCFAPARKKLGRGRDLTLISPTNRKSPSAPDADRAELYKLEPYRMSELRLKTQMRLTRVATAVLRALRLRDGIVRRRTARAQMRREAAEARGDDRLSKPALHQLDVKLNSIIARDAGFFVEAGANDGFTQSNSYWLERFREWRGLLIEPIPELAEQAELTRPAATVVQCALVADDNAEKSVRMCFGDLMSMVDGARGPEWPGLGTVLGWRDPYELDVETRTLSSLLDEIGAPEVDLLSLDVEGFEEPALRGLDLERHAPRYVLVEIHDREQEHPPLDAILGERYIEHSWLSPVDLLYVRRDVLI